MCLKKNSATSKHPTFHKIVLYNSDATVVKRNENIRERLLIHTEGIATVRDLYKNCFHSYIPTIVAMATWQMAGNMRG